MDKEKARRKRWNDSEKGRAARREYDKKTYESSTIRTKKGIKAVYMKELEGDGLSLNGHLNQSIVEYLYTKGYSDADLEEIHEEAKKEGLE